MLRRFVASDCGAESMMIVGEKGADAVAESNGTAAVFQNDSAQR
jgi:hypothetical protein